MRTTCVNPRQRMFRTTRTSRRLRYLPDGDVVASSDANPAPRSVARSRVRRRRVRHYQLSSCVRSCIDHTRYFFEAGTGS